MSFSKWKKLLFGPRGCCSTTVGSIEDVSGISYKNFNELNISRDSTLEYQFEQRCFLKLDEIPLDEVIDDGKSASRTSSDSDQTQRSSSSNESTCEVNTFHRLRLNKRRSLSMSNVLDMTEKETADDNIRALDKGRDKVFTFPPKRKKDHPSPLKYMEKQYKEGHIDLKSGDNKKLAER